MTCRREVNARANSSVTARVPRRVPSLLAALARATSMLWLIAFGPTQAATVVPLTRGLGFTSTQHIGYASSVGEAPVADSETVYSVTSVNADKVDFVFYISSAQDPGMRVILSKVEHRFDRIVRRTDLQSAARVTITFSSEDPALMPGQTFAGTSAAVLQSLSTQGQVAFVLGVNESEGFGTLAASLGGSMRKANPGGLPAMMGGFLMSLDAVRHYYRGTLKRVGAGDEAFSVLLNGKRTTVPALHARGDMTFTDKTITPDMWWLDDPGNPMMLEWKVGIYHELVTRIDFPQGPSGVEGSAPGSGSGGAAAGLGGKDCRAELSGVYFTTGSAAVLDASMPALERFAALMTAHPDWLVTVEGHTDNVGSAEYNMDLSTHRAAAVRDVLVNQFKVPANRLQAKGYGLTRPVESNATDQGRAHNRRVEVSRACQ